MPSNEIARIVRPAPRGSKRDWVARTTLLPPETAERLDKLCDIRVAYRVDVMQEAIERMLETDLPAAA